jgi:uncharacterized membrane protein HdeD (DUF308 family)
MSTHETLPRKDLLDGGSPIQGPVARVTEQATRYWWVLLAVGIAWIAFSAIVFRFDYTTVKAIGILFGVVALGAAANEVLVSTVSTTGWRIVHLLVALLFTAAGIVSFFHPTDSFVALAALVGFYLIFRGTLDMVMGISSTGTVPGWWLVLITGIAEILIGFWAAASWDLSVTVLVAWIGAIALMRGIAEIVGAFELRSVNRAVRRSPV